MLNCYLIIQAELAAPSLVQAQALLHGSESADPSRIPLPDLHQATVHQGNYSKNKTRLRSSKWEGMSVSYWDREGETTE